VFRADSTGEYISKQLRGVLAEQGTLAQFSCPGAHAQNGVAERKHRHLLETTRAMMIASSLPPHFWADAVSTLVYLINIQPSATLHGGIPLERLSGRSSGYSTLCLFGCGCYVLLAPRECTKLTAQSVECVFLKYSDEHKGYRCWDLVGHRMRISHDVMFDETRPFYPCPTSSTYPMEDISFLLFPDTPPPVSIDPPSGPIIADASPSTPSSSSSPGSPPSSSDSPSTSPLCPFPFHYSRRSTVPDTPRDVSSSSSSDVSSSSDEIPSPLPARQHCPPDRYSPSQYSLSVALELTSYWDAERHPEWELAMAEEIAALEHTGTWDLISSPPGVRPITCKWVYKIKTRSDGSLERYKARLVARGFQQEQGRDYDETFASVAHMTIVRTLLAVASVRHWSVSQLDVQNTFLNGALREEVYMQPPPGYFVPDGIVCHLRCSLYGLKQAPRTWFERFAYVVTAAGFSPSAHDPAMFVHISPRGRTLLLLYVDDMIITGDDSKYIAFVKARLRDQFVMTDLGPLRYFLEIEVSSTSDGFSISQEKYIQDLLARAALRDEHTVETPMELNVQLHASDGDALPDLTCYHHIIGSLVYLVVTHPDISYPVHFLSQFVSAPTTIHYSHLLHVMRYLRGTLTRRLFFPCSSSLQLQAYSDATWVRDPMDIRSLSAYCVFLGGSLIAWKTKKQTAVSHSSVEAELRAMALLTTEVTWLRWLLTDFGISPTTPTTLLSHSTGAISIAHDPVKHELTKHIGVDAFYTHASAQDQVIALHYVTSELQLADFLQRHRLEHNIVSFSPNSVLWIDGAKLMK
jgi:hypothetical protein